MGAERAEFGLLGPLTVTREGTELTLGGPKQRALLAMLLLEANHAVSADRLIDALWGDHPPDTAKNTLQVYVSQLRKLLPEGSLETVAPGYRLAVAPEAIDLSRFEELAQQGRAALGIGDAAAAAQALGEALALWRGPALADLALEEFAQAEAARLEELRLGVLEDRIEADLALGRHGPLVAELERLISENPFRERLRAQLMLALYRSGRQAEALAVYQRTRRTLVDELGIEPGESLRQLEQAILAHDPSLDPPAPARPARRVPAPATPLLGRAHELLLVDNFEQVLAAAPTVARLLAHTSKVKLVVTSRAPLHVAAEREFPVQPLADDEAAELFVARAQAANPDFALSEQNASAV